MKVFLNSSWWQALKKWVKVAVCIFKENSYFLHSGVFAQSGNIFGPKSTKIQKFNKVFSLNFFKILSDDRYAKGSEKDFFYFLGQCLLCPKNPAIDAFGYKIDKFHISCFNALFFLIVLTLKSRFLCYFIFVLLLLPLLLCLQVIK